jgi:ABC-type transporter Mla subunit MlaD
MKRLAGIIAAVALSVALLVVASGAGGDEDSYEVRAIFDNAGFLVTGEEVRIGGAKVGSISEIDVTGTDEIATEEGEPSPGKAVVVMQIDDPGFHDFRADASCLIRPQSLIGEKFVECEPTQPRSADSPEAPPLEQIAEGEAGEGQYLLPLENNGKAVDIDLVNNIMEEPYPDRFRLILNNLGASFAARGEELAEIIERSNPALRETNELLATLARQNRTLAQLSSDSDAIISALARERTHVSGFINESNIAAEATAERSADLEESFARFPGFLRELRSTMTELDAFSTAATPVFSDLGDAAPSLTRATKALGPFSDAGTTAVTSLGRAADDSIGPLVNSDPVIRQVRKLANSGKPATKNLKAFLKSWRKTEGFDYFADFLFFASGAVNGFDQYGHFIRALLPLNNCVDYETVPEPGCNGNFGASLVRTPAQEIAAEKRLMRRAAKMLGLDPKVRAGDAETEDRAEPTAPELDVDPGVEETPAEPTEPAPEEEPPPTDAAPGLEPSAGATATSAKANMRATRALLDFLIGDRPARSKR